ncbi:SEC14 cytosolic factor-like isoform X2 [Zingiber officinale]|uniref:SEC14 cytosolic factor-like isoform X2 n=1 Tax=Zingiber officinale TaxID=94328 RepID=UPI001C4C05B8|nr:SEC14 cytosolic factor-like isoform X2 [Zingiber officinale]
MPPASLLLVELHRSSSFPTTISSLTSGFASGSAAPGRMAVASQDAVKQLSVLLDQADETLKRTFQGYPTATLVRFLNAREWNVAKAHKMLVDCLNWRTENRIDDILTKPIIPSELYRGVRDSQLVGLSGYSKEGLPVFAIGAGLSSFDKASVNYYVQSHIQINEYRDRVILPAATKKYHRYIGTCIKVLDTTGLKLSALGHIKLLTLIATIDDLNYPEKTQTYYVVNAPYVFSACWKVVKPLLQERTRRKVQVLQGCGRDELLKVMDYNSLPHFCLQECYKTAASHACYSLDHSFHQELYNYMKQQALGLERAELLKHRSSRADTPGADTDRTKLVKVKIGDQAGLACSLSSIQIMRHERAIP